MNRALILVAVLLAITVFVVWLVGDRLYADLSGRQANLTYSITLLVLAVSSLVLGWRGTFSEAVRSIIIWIGLFFFLILAYSYRDQFNFAVERVAGEINPARPTTRSNAEVVLQKANDGHFYVDTDINGTSIRMLADTGASAIALSVEDAESAGIDVEQLEFIHSVFTANGQAAAAEIRLDEVRVGPIVRQDVRAVVTKGLSASLLGMSFFNTLSKVEIESDELILRD